MEEHTFITQRYPNQVEKAHLDLIRVALSDEPVK